MQYKSIANFIAYVVIFISLIVTCSLNAQEKEESLYDQISRAVVRLEHIDVITRSGQNDTLNIPKSNGTGFFVLYKNNSFLVSTRHVVEKNYDLRARVKIRNIILNQFEVIELRIPKDSWVFHPNHGSNSVRYVDVAALKLPSIKNRAILGIQESLFAEKDPEPPDDILVFGYPLVLGFELREQKPLARVGIVALIAKEKFLKLGSKYVHKETRLLDVPMFPGNSGSPVFLKPSLGVKLELIGLVIAGNERLDYAVCEPISCIKEVLERTNNLRKPMPSWLLLP